MHYGENMNIHVYSVQPKCKTIDGKELYLTANSSSATVSTLDSNDKNEQTHSQLWIPISIFTDNINGFSLVNLATNMAIGWTKNNDVVELCMPDKTENWAIWKFIKQDDEPFGAIQLQGNTGQNLNVKGDSPYKSGTSVMSYRWKHGQENEIWQFKKVPVEGTHLDRLQLVGASKLEK